MKYSKEIKELAVLKYKEWEDKKILCKFFKICSKTLETWIQREQNMGFIEDKRKNNGSRKRFSNEDLKEFYNSNQNATLEDWWRKFNVTAQAIKKRLKQMNYSYKKKTWNTKKEMKKKGENF